MKRIFAILGMVLVIVVLGWTAGFPQGGTGIGQTYTTYKESTTAPATPGSTYDRLFFKSDGPHFVNSAGIDSYIRAGGNLLSVTNVSLGADADTTIYTVPTGKRCVLTYAILVVGADAGTTTISIGKDTAETDFLGNQTLSALDAQYDAAILMPVPNATSVLIKSYAAATVIQAKVASHAGGATNALYLFGFLY